MKTLLLFVALNFVTPLAFAISNQELEQACLQTGTQKIAAEAKAANCQVDLDEVVPSQTENSWLSSKKSVSYSARTNCNVDGVLTVQVQYSAGKCF